jgi:hypothetical protein
MPDPERLLTTLRRAAAGFRAQPGRRGRVVTLLDAADVFGISSSKKSFTDRIFIREAATNRTSSSISSRPFRVSTPTASTSCRATMNWLRP